MKYIISVLLYVTGVVTFGILCTVYLMFLMIFPSRYLHWMASSFCRLISIACGQWVIVEGEVPRKKDGPHLYIFNHTSILDPFPLGVAIGYYLTAIMAKEQFRWPIWGWAMRKYGVISIDRNNRSKAIGSIIEAEEAVEAGTSVLIGPEGTRTTDGKIRPFKKGPFHLVKNTRVTIAPMVISGAYRAKNKNSWLLRPGIIRVRFLAPILASDYQDETVESLSHLAHDIMCEALKDLEGEE